MAEKSEVIGGNELTITVRTDVGQAVAGFKALRRELRELTKAAREAERALDDINKTK